MVIIPCGITAKMKEEDRKALYQYCEAREAELKAEGVRVTSDLRENYSPGWKFNHWELKVLEQKKPQITYFLNSLN